MSEERWRSLEEMANRQAEGCAVDAAFAQAVRRFGRAAGKRGALWEESGADLAGYLLSDKPLGQGERVTFRH